MSSLLTSLLLNQMLEDDPLGSVLHSLKIPKLKYCVSQALISQFRDKELGGRIFGATTGSAPTAPEVVEFLKDALVIPITEGYGSTEAGDLLLSQLYSCITGVIMMCLLRSSKKRA